MVQDNIRDIEKSAGLHKQVEGPESRGFLLDQIDDLNLDLLKNLEASLQEEADPIGSLEEALTAKFRVSVNDRLLSFMRSLEEQTVSAEEAGSEDPSE